MNQHVQTKPLYTMGGRDALVDVLAELRSIRPPAPDQAETPEFRRGLSAAAGIVEKEIELRRKGPA